MTKTPSHQGKAHTWIHYKDGSSILNEEPIGEVTMTENNLCKVGLMAQRTIQIVQFEPIKIGCSIEIPAQANEIDDVYEFAKEWLDGKMETLVDEVKKAGK